MHSFLTYNELRERFLAPKARFVKKINDACQEEYYKDREYRSKLSYVVFHSTFDFDNRPLYHEVLICENEQGCKQCRYVTGTNIPAIMQEASLLLLGEMPASYLSSVEEFEQQLDKTYKEYEIDTFEDLED